MSWWTDLSPEQQRDYIREHPRSKYARGAAPKSPIPNAVAPTGRVPSRPNRPTHKVARGELTGDARALVNVGIGAVLTSQGLGNLDGARAGRLPSLPDRVVSDRTPMAHTGPDRQAPMAQPDHPRARRTQADRVGEAKRRVQRGG